MKVYISLPISGHCVEQCVKRAETAKEWIASKGHEAVTPFDISPDLGLSYAQHMGKDIEALIGCDAIFLLAGWSESKGCRLEWQCALIYNKKVFTHISQIKPNEKN